MGGGRRADAVPPHLARGGTTSRTTAAGCGPARHGCTTARPSSRTRFTRFTRFIRFTRFTRFTRAARAAHTDT
eukprot:3048562-Prymnesium_polylepis.1